MKLDTLVRFLAAGSLAGAVAACGSSPASSDVSASPSRPSYLEDVYPIFATHCLSCHSTGGVSEAAELDRYDSAVSVAPRLPHVLTLGEMPPWGVDASGTCGTWVDAPYLSTAEQSTVLKWITNGAPRGLQRGSFEAPSRPTLRPDRTLDVGASFDPSLDALTRCFIVDPNIMAEGRMTAFSYDGSLGIQQVTLYGLDDDASVAKARALDAADPRPGYDCRGGADVADARFLVGATRGEGTMRLPEGTGVRLRAGRPLVAQLQYDLLVDAHPPSTTVSIELDESARAARWVDVRATNQQVPSGTNSALTVGTYVAPSNLTVRAVYPQMGLQGKSMTVTRDGAGGRGRSCLLNQYLWDLHTMRAPRKYQTPEIIEAGSLVTVSCTFNTPESQAPVSEGDGTEDCAVSLYADDGT